MNQINHFQSKKRPQEKISRNENIVFTVFCWIFMIGTWLLFVVPFYLWVSYGKIFMNDPKVQFNAANSFFIGIISYIIHFILQLCSLCSNFSCFTIQDSLKGKIESFFKDKPTFILSLKCYHYESEVERYVDEQGYTQERTITYKVYSFDGDKTVDYYSCRDVSGLFEISINEEDAKNIEYLILKIDYDITYYNDNSVNDFEILKEDVKNSCRDTYREIDEKIKFQEIQKNNVYIFKLNNNKKNCSINGCFFFILILIPFVEFYKLYIKSKCLFKHFTFIKLISMRTNLNNVREPDIYNPQIKVNDQLYNISPSSYIYVNNSYKNPKIKINERRSEENVENVGNNINDPLPSGINLKINISENEFNNMLNGQPIIIQVRQNNENNRNNNENSQNNLNNQNINQNNQNINQNNQNINQINIVNNKNNEFNINNEITKEKNQNINEINEINYENNQNNLNSNRNKLIIEDAELNYEKCSNFSNVI